MNKTDAPLLPCPKGHVPTLYKNAVYGMGRFEYGFACPCERTVGLYPTEEQARDLWNDDQTTVGNLSVPQTPAVAPDGLVERLQIEAARNGGQGAYAWSARELCGKAANKIIELQAAIAAMPGSGPGAWVPADHLAEANREIARLREALAWISPIRIEDGPDYAEVYFGDSVKHSTQAMTMNPEHWRTIAALASEPKA